MDVIRSLLASFPFRTLAMISNIKFAIKVERGLEMAADVTSAF